MADTEDTPATPTQPKAPARRAPRKSTAAKSTAAKTTAAKPAASRTRKTAAPVETAKTTDTPKSPKRPALAKPRAAGRAKPPTKRAPRTKAATEQAEEKGGRGWTKAALVGGLATVGAAATAALLSLRGSTPKKDAPPALPEPEKVDAPVDTATATTAHQPDGTDATKSFKAGIADENTIPG